MWILVDLIILALVNGNWFFALGSFINITFTVLTFFFAPGFFGLNILFHKKFPYPELLRIPISFGLSVIVSSLTLLLLSRFEITQNSLIIILVLVNLFGFVSIALRLINYQKPEFLQWLNILEILRREKVFAISMLISISILVIAFSRFWVRTETTHPQFTEFYTLGVGGQTSDYLSDIFVDTPYGISLGIVNHSGTGNFFSIYALVGEEVVGYIESIQIMDGEEWEDDLIVIIGREGKNQKINIFLSCDGCEFPNRELSLWVDVSNADAGEPN